MAAALLALAVPVACALGYLAAVNPMLGVGAMVVLVAARAFAFDGSLAVAGFAAATYFELVGEYTGAALSPIKLSGALLVVLAALALAVRARRAVAGRTQASTGWRRHPVLLATCAGFVAWAVVSAAWAVDLTQVRTLGLRLVTDALVFVAVPVFLRTTAHVRVLGWTLLASAAASTAAGQVLGTQVGGRAIGTFTDPNEFAGALVAGLAFGLAVSESSSSPLARWAGRVLAVEVLAGIVGSGSRGGMVAVVFAFTALLLTSRGRERVRLTGFVLTGLAVGAAWLTLAPAGGVVLERLSDGDSSGRSDLWQVAVYQFRDEPVHGIGLGNYPILSQRYLRHDVQNADLFVRQPRVAHSTPLELMAELGAVGFLLYYTMFGACLVHARRVLRLARRRRDRAHVGAARGLLSALVATLGASLFLSAQYTELTWVLFGCAVALAAMSRRMAEASPPATAARGTSDRPHACTGA